MFQRKTELKVVIKELADSIRRSADMIMSSELVSMKRVMRRLDLCDRNDVPTLKGKVAAHISTSDEILLTEMLFSGLFNDMEHPAHISAVLSCLVYTEGKAGSQEGVQKIVKHEKLGQPFMLLQKIIQKLLFFYVGTPKGENLFTTIYAETSVVSDILALTSSPQ